MLPSPQPTSSILSHRESRDNPSLRRNCQADWWRLGLAGQELPDVLNQKMMLRLGLLDHMSWKSSLGCETTSTAIIADIQLRTANQAKEQNLMVL